MSHHRDLIDFDRSVDLTAFGAPGVLAATLVDDDGDQHLVLVDCSVIRDPCQRYYPDCPSAPHEATGPLPLDVLRRVVAAQRTHRPPEAGEP